MEEKRMLSEEGLAYFFEQLKTVFEPKKNAPEKILYLHTLAFEENITSPEGEPFHNVYLFVITTDPTPAKREYGSGSYNNYGYLNVKFELSQIIAAYGGYTIGGGSVLAYYIPVELSICHYFAKGGTYIEQAIIPQMSSSSYEGSSSPEVVLYSDSNQTFIGDTVTEI